MREGYSGQRFKSFLEVNTEIECIPATEERQGILLSNFDPFAMPETPTPAPRPQQTQPITGGL